jgi:hypothetical protein
MPPVAPQPIQISCPACSTPFRTAIYTLVDVTQQPELKSLLLGGRINLAVCPNCRTASMLAAPLIYHDAAKQLCLVYFPQELNSRPNEQERFVGEATSFLMRSLPADAPRSHLLAPRRFLTLPSLLDAVLEADGISRETLNRQRTQIELISELAGLLTDDAAFSDLVEQRWEELTPEFFATLAAFIEATPPQQSEAQTMLLQLQERLMAQLGGSTHDDAELDQAIDRLIAASDAELEPVVADLRAMIDYGFYQRWNARIEAAEAAGQPEQAALLESRRARLLTVVEELDRQAQAMFESGSKLLDELFATPDPLAALRERADRVDEAFMMVLSANAAAAQRADRTDLVEQFGQLAEAALGIIQERMTPEDRFINELLAAETPQQATRMLRTSVAKITPDLVKRLNELATQEEQHANKPTADRLRQLARECAAMLF